MLILYVILVLSTIAVVGVAWVCYRHIRRHLHAAHPERVGGMAMRARDVNPRTGAT
ncbi:MAG: hypothetical protein ACE14L_03805 [Terriglobales bacterium]